METYEKIRLMREMKQWSQEEMADKLAMSAGGYAKIERGETRLHLPRLQRIAAIFDVDVWELVQNDKSLFYQINNDGHNSNHIAFYSAPEQINSEIEKLNLIISHKNELLRRFEQENQALKDMIELLKQQQTKS